MRIEYVLLLQACKRAVKTHFESQWVADTQNLPKTQYLDLTRFINMAYI